MPRPSGKAAISSKGNAKEALIKSARELGERIIVRKRFEIVGVFCVFQGFTNAFLAEMIRQCPKTH